jgi:uncharacterized protein (TIGR02246 family)
MAPDERQIHELLDEWRERTARNDVDGVLELMADDAVFLTCGQEPMTKAGFAAAARAMAGKVHFDATQEVKELQIRGDLAYAWTWISVAVTLPDGGKKTREGYTLTVFRKSAAGKWQLSRDANLMPR